MLNKNPKIRLVNPAPALNKSSAKIPEELRQLDGVALAAVKPDANLIPETPNVIRSSDPANNTEFNLHPDGTLMKCVPRPDAAPQHLLVDGHGRVFGIARNAEVADLICNGVNALNLARVMLAAEDAKESAGGVPPVLLLPPVNTDNTIIEGDSK